MAVNIQGTASRIRNSPLRNAEWGCFTGQGEVGVISRRDE